MLYQEELARSRQDTANRLKNRLVVGAYQHDSLVGTVGFNQGETAKTRHKGYIWGLYVSDKHRGLGIGERLITELLARLDPQVVQITLSVVKENRSAISLYQRVGFTCYGEEPRALKNTDGYSDEVLMYRLI
ncbi:putative acetyltransferase [Serratia ficaria]|nr:putative acetyltransferase [Serratia ficaria]CAI0809113.1 putative acetyltransferase [Serratia ficaria]CAI1008906.1 putative acetyltransferase [Serratia ficaria]CAI1673811.1 putative acetyltransferase [Serratia ficaria]CAI1745839.1 putative acetyltransferase [Serratia ficaria]